jgi:hypothetical protein
MRTNSANCRCRLPAPLNPTNVLRGILHLGNCAFDVREGLPSLASHGGGKWSLLMGVFFARYQDPRRANGPSRCSRLPPPLRQFEKFGRLHVQRRRQLADDFEADVIGALLNLAKYSISQIR